MIFSREFCAAIDKCVSGGFPFAVAIIPNDSKPLFFATEKLIDCTCGVPDDWNGFVVATFGVGESQSPQGIEARFSIEEILKLDITHENYTIDSQSHSHESSTSYSDYITTINTVVSNFDDNNSKVVISRVISAKSEMKLLGVAESYFSKFTNCFRALYYTPHTGLWIVATPEILLKQSKESGVIETMSLAGTRRIGDKHWDLKNLSEHQLVTDYICAKFESSGLSAEVATPSEVRFGEIEHLCNHIRATGSTDILKLALKLSPTPAVCGFPVASAMDTITKMEGHNRECYGSFVGVVNELGSNLFVNLRCAKVTSLPSGNYEYTMYSGGGINKMSVAETEWTETEMKISPLYNIVTNKK